LLLVYHAKCSKETTAESSSRKMPTNLSDPSGSDTASANPLSKCEGRRSTDRLGVSPASAGAALSCRQAAARSHVKNLSPPSGFPSLTQAGSEKQNTRRNALFRFAATGRRVDAGTIEDHRRITASIGDAHRRPTHSVANLPAALQSPTNGSFHLHGAKSATQAME
jgi:hypothetical protein